MFQSLRSQYRRAPDDPPHTPGPLPWMGVAVAYGKDAGALLTGLKAAHGDTFSVFLAGDRVTFVTNPHDYTPVLACRDLDFHELANQISATAFGHGVEGIEAISEPVNKLAIEKMRGEALVAMTRDAQRCLEEALATGVPQRTDDFYDWLSGVVFAATGRAVFGEGFQHEVDRSEFRAVDEAFPLLLAGVPASILRVAEARRSVSRAMAIGREAAAQITVDRLRIFAEHSDPADVGAYQLAFLWATQANTLPAVFWALYYAIRDPRAKAALTDEVRTVMAGAERDPETGRPIFSRETLGQLVYVDSAIDEALRLTSGSLTIRVALRDLTLELDGGKTLRVREGERVGLYPWLTHHNPEIYPEPDAYRFDRFVEDGKRKRSFTLHGRKVANYLMPFGGGVSMCPGRHFARNEIKIALALLLHDFELEALPGPMPGFVSGRAGLGVFGPDRPVSVAIRRR